MTLSLPGAGLAEHVSDPREPPSAQPCSCEAGRDGTTKTGEDVRSKMAWLTDPRTIAGMPLRPRDPITNNRAPRAASVILSDGVPVRVKLAL